MLSAHQRADLQRRGFVLLKANCPDLELLRIAKDLGPPVPSTPGAPVISELRPRQPLTQKTQTFSSLYGLASFPFHTDTAHWPVPARFVILRDIGESHDRPTLLLPMEKFALACTPQDMTAAIWKVKGPFGTFYCSIIEFANTIRRIRYDPICMRAGNDPAIRVNEALSTKQRKPIRVDWEPSLALIIDNWRILHGRGRSLRDDSRSRCLQRVLIFDNEQLPLFPYVLAA
jgi:hypothetical protein